MEKAYLTMVKAAQFEEENRKNHPKNRPLEISSSNPLLKRPAPDSTNQEEDIREYVVSRELKKKKEKKNCGMMALEPLASTARDSYGHNSLTIQQQQSQQHLLSFITLSAGITGSELIEPTALMMFHETLNQLIVKIVNQHVKKYKIEQTKQSPLKTHDEESKYKSLSSPSDQSTRSLKSEEGGASDSVVDNVVLYDDDDFVGRQQEQHAVRDFLKVETSGSG